MYIHKIIIKIYIIQYDYIIRARQTSSEVNTDIYKICIKKWHKEQIISEYSLINKRKILKNTSEVDENIGKQRWAKER